MHWSLVPEYFIASENDHSLTKLQTKFLKIFKGWRTLKTKVSLQNSGGTSGVKHWARSSTSPRVKHPSVFMILLLIHSRDLACWELQINLKTKLCVTVSFQRWVMWGETIHLHRHAPNLCSATQATWLRWNLLKVIYHCFPSSSVP